MVPGPLARYATWAARHGARLDAGPGDDASVPGQQPETVASFGLQWARHPTPYPEAKLQGLVLGQTGLDASYFSGRVVLDAGCGHGSQAAYMASLGARVVGVDLAPEAAAVAHRKIGQDGRGLVVEADLARLPFPDRSFDLVYSEGVLHHTRDPRASFRHLVRKVRPGGHIAAGFYLKPSWWTGRLRLWANDGLRRLLAPLPTSWVRAIAFLSVPLTRVPGVRPVAARSFVFWDPENPGWRETWQLNFDWYGTHHYQYYFTEAEILALFQEPALGLTEIFRGRANFFRGTVSRTAQADQEMAAGSGSRA